MNITELCNKQRDMLLPRWVELFFAGYPLDGSGFLRTQHDPFANPVGRITREALTVLYDAVAGNDTEPEAVRAAVDELMRLRAVQDMPPSKAVGPLLLVKTLLRQAVMPEWLKAEEGRGGDADAVTGRLDAYLAVESRVDSLGLLALDFYAGAREKVFNLRVEEIKRSQSQVVRWAKLRSDAADGAGSPGC